MICDVCGRENADGLTYCQDCGRRLKPREARVVPPTPPNGLPKVELPAAEPPQRPSYPPRTRPEAPSFSFAPPDAAPSRTPPPAPAAPAPTRSSAAAQPPPPLAASPSAPDTQRCPTCQADNPPLYRYCVACGTPLGAGGAAPAARSGEREPIRPSALASTAPPASARGGSSAPQAPAADERIVPTPVVDIASSRQPPKLLTCSRCQGQCAPGTRFCKFCGASLDDGRAASAAPAPASDAKRASPSAAPVPLVRPASTAKPAPTIPGDSPAPPRTPAPPPREAPAQRAPAHAVAPSSGRLVVIAEDGTEGRVYPFTGPQLDVGRLEGDVVLGDDPYVSPRHARVLQVDGQWVLRDLGSTNGIFFRIRGPERLRDGDLLLLGLEVLQFQAVSNAERGLGHASQHGTLLFGSPATPRHARLCQRTVEGVTRDVYHLVRDETVIGREHGDIVFTADPFLSRRHAAVTRDPATGEFSIVDLDSSNGTYLAIREDVPLASGDYVRIGQHLFRVDLGES